MKKVLAATLVTIFVLLFTSVGAFAAQTDDTKQIRCDQFIAVYLSDPEPHWRGTLSNCSLDEFDGAEVHYWGQPEGYDVGKVAHFYENFQIIIGNDVITGNEIGVWNLTTFKFRAEGRVTGATGEWTYLIGYKFHEMGTTDDPFLPGWTILKGPSTMFLVGP